MTDQRDVTALPILLGPPPVMWVTQRAYDILKSLGHDLRRLHVYGGSR